MRKLLVWVMILVGIVANDEIILYSTTHHTTPQQIEKVFQKAGYRVEQNRDMNGPFLKQFRQSDFEIYNLMTVYYPSIAMQLVLQEPDSGIFAPFSIVIFKKKGAKKTYAGVLSAKAKAKILGLTLDTKLLQELEDKNKETLQKALPQAKRETLPYKPREVKEKLLSKYSFEVDPDEALDVKDEVEMMIEDGLKPIGFVMASFNDFGYDLKEAGIKDFIFYDAYSLCKLKVIYTVARIRPEAGVFAPCTLAIYQKRGDDHMYIVFPNIYNWIATLDLQDKKAIAELKKAQKDMEAVIKNALP